MKVLCRQNWLLSESDSIRDAVPVYGFNRSMYAKPLDVGEQYKEYTLKIREHVFDT